jgi:hypothetical protein
LEEFFQDEGSVPLFSEKLRWISVGLIFDRVHGGQPYSATKPWHGKGGIIPQIWKALDLPESSNFTYVLEEVINCKKFGLAYEGGWQMQSEATILGRVPFIEHDSVEAQIIADSQDNGASIWHSHFVTNTYRREQGLISLTLSAVFGLILCLKPQAPSKGQTHQARQQ